MSAQISHPVPKDRSVLSGRDWFPFVFSKVAPLEEWNVILSSDDITRDRYASELSFHLAKSDTYAIPRFCFRFFRIDHEPYRKLFTAIDGYQGAVAWRHYGNCVGAFSQKLWTNYPPLFGSMRPEEAAHKLEDAIRNPPKPDPDFVQRAIDDIPRFCQHLESYLGLAHKGPLDFDEKWLIREGLRTSRAMFDNFVERGDHMPTLVRPLQAGQGGASSSPQRLYFGVTAEEMGTLLGELGAQYDKDPIAAEYPLLSRLSDVASASAYRADEIEKLLTEIVRAQAIAIQPRSVRALDKLSRVAKWAEKYGAGVSFSGQ
jgi:hypothetical protein